MSLKDSYINAVNLISKHAITANLIMVVALGGVGASATELLAPEEYKPSNIIQKTFNRDFTQNSVPDKNPFTALKPDNQYDVVKFEECDLAIKYPKKLGDQEILVTYGASFGSTEGGINPIAGVRINRFDIQCYNKNDLQPILNTESNSSLTQKISSLFSTPKVYADSGDINTFTLKPLDTKEFYDMTNWFIFEGEITDIYEITNFDEFKIPEFKDNEKYVRFTHKDKVYFTYFETTRIERSPGSQNFIYQEPIEARQIQLQFNSLVSSEINAEIKKETVQSQSISDNFKYLFAQLEDGGETWAVFLEDKDKQVYMLKNVQPESVFGEAINNISEVEFEFSITGTVLAKKQAVEQMEGTPPQKVDFEFVELGNVVLVGNNTQTKSSNSSVAVTKNLKTYTNPFFPDFKLVYDDSWKFETNTEPAFENLLTRRIKLTKNGKTLKFVINPILPFGGEPIFVPDSKTCQPGTSQEDLIKEGTLKIDNLGNVEKFTIKTDCKNGWEDLNNKVYYGNLGVDSFFLKSNIKAKDIKNYDFAPEDGFVRYRVSQIGEIDANDVFVSEIDQIVSQSSFK